MARGAWKGTLKDDTDLSTVTLKQGQVVTLVGAADKLAARPTEEVVRAPTVQAPVFNSLQV